MSVRGIKYGIIAAIKYSNTNFLIMLTLSNPIFTSTILATNRTISVCTRFKVTTYNKMRSTIKQYLTDFVRVLAQVASKAHATRITTSIEFSTYAKN